MNNSCNRSERAEKRPQGVGTMLKWLLAVSMFTAVFVMSSCKDDDNVTANTFTVTFSTEEGSAVDRQKVQQGKTATKPADPTREGFTFGGWYSDEGLTAVYDFKTPVKANIILYAKWVSIPASDDPTPTAQTFTVTFSTGEGSAVKAQTVAEGAAVARPEDPTREGYVFGGWYTDEGLTAVYDFATPVSADITLYANWMEVIQTFTVTFSTGEGSAVDAQTVVAGAAVARPEDPTREGYVFGGWYTDEGLTAVYDFATPVSADITLYAKWDQSMSDVDISAADLIGTWEAEVHRFEWTNEGGRLARGEREEFEFIPHTWTFTDNEVTRTYRFPGQEEPQMLDPIRYRLDLEQNAIVFIYEGGWEVVHSIISFNGSSLKVIQPEPVSVEEVEELSTIYSRRFFQEEYTLTKEE